jgi:hypothetical protein
MPLKLYLGCALPPFHPQHTEVLGNIDEWTLVDYFVDHPSIKKWDARTLIPVGNGTVEKIYNSHLIEHFPHVEVPTILRVWYSKLQDGGELIINTPDLLWAAKRLVKYGQGGLLDGYFNTFSGDHGLLSIFYGTESHEGEYHKGGFTKDYMIQLLTDIGFKEVTVEETFDAHEMQVLIARAKK